MPRSNEARTPGRAFRTVARLLLLLALAAVPAQAEEINRLVLRVNDEILTLFDYEERKAEEVNQILEDVTLSPAQRQDALTRAPKAVLFGVFREMLLQSHAARTGTTVTDREVDAAIDGLREQQGLPDNDALREALAASGLTFEELRANMRREILLSQVIRRDVTAKIEVSEDELRAYYRNNSEEFRVPEEKRLEEIIVLEESGLGAEELQQKARTIYEEIVAGEDFAAVADRHKAEGISTGTIDLGWLNKGDLGRALDDAAWGLEPGQVSEPVDGRGGYHILRLLEARGGELKPYSDVEQIILANERNRRFGKQLNTFMADLAETSYIVEDVPPEAIGYRSLSDFSDADAGQEELPGFRGPLKRPDAAAAAVEEAAPAGATDEAGADGPDDTESPAEDDGDGSGG